MCLDSAVKVAFRPLLHDKKPKVVRCAVHQVPLDHRLYHVLVVAEELLTRVLAHARIFWQSQRIVEEEEHARHVGK